MITRVNSNRSPRCDLQEPGRCGFTLLEVVLALALSATVMYLLVTALELFMFRVDSSRSRVEAAQVARSVLDRITADLQALKLTSPRRPAGRSGDGSQATATDGALTGGGGSPTTSTFDTGFSSTSGQDAAPALVGTALELRLNRGARRGWERLTRIVDPTEQSDDADFPQTVRYFVADEDRRTAEEQAAAGVSAEPAVGLSGLYRQCLPTAALQGASTSLLSNSSTGSTGTALPEEAVADMLAPEVVEISFAYFDGQQLIDEWDSSTGGPPLGIEITLRIMETSYEEACELQSQSQLERRSVPEDQLVEYRRFVSLDAIVPQPPDQMLLVGGGGGGRGGRGGGNGNGGGNNGEGNNGGGGGGGRGGGDDND